MEHVQVAAQIPVGQSAEALQLTEQQPVRFRDESLCAKVRQRRTLFSSSWGYAPARCRQLVADGAAADRGELEKMKRAYVAGAIKLRDFRIERNGNGRDTEAAQLLLDPGQVEDLTPAEWAMQAKI